MSQSMNAHHNLTKRKPTNIYVVTYRIIHLSNKIDYLINTPYWNALAATRIFNRILVPTQSIYGSAILSWIPYSLLLKDIVCNQDADCNMYFWYFRIFYGELYM